MRGPTRRGSSGRPGPGIASGSREAAVRVSPGRNVAATSGSPAQGRRQSGTPLHRTAIELQTQRERGHGDSDTATRTRRLRHGDSLAWASMDRSRPHLPHPRHLRPARASTDGGWGGARRGRGRGRGEEGGLPGDGYFHYPARFVTGKGTVTGASLPGGGRDVWGCGQGIPGRGRGTAGCGGKGSGCGGSSRVCGVTGSRPE